MGNEAAKNRNSDELLNKKIAVLKANSNLSDKEIREVYTDFKNECPSGKMNKQQFHKYYKKLADADDREGVLSDVAFRVFDTNGDGAIDFSEFVMAYGTQNKQDLDSQLELVFSMLDSSGDGRVNFNEMVQFMNVALQLAGKEAKGTTGYSAASDVFDVLGVNKDQSLTKKQFIDGCKRNKELNEVFGL